MLTRYILLRGGKKGVVGMFTDEELDWTNDEILLLNAGPRQQGLQ